MTDINLSVAVNFFLVGIAAQFAYRRLYHVPRVGDRCVFNEVRYEVTRIEWCLDEDATTYGIRVNVELQKLSTRKKK
jgi:hypothetical protein